MKKNNLNNNIGYQSPKVLNWLSARTDAPILAESQVETKVKIDAVGQETEDFTEDKFDSEWE